MPSIDMEDYTKYWSFYYWYIRQSNKLNNEGQHGFRGSHGALYKETKTIAIKHYKSA